MDLSSILSEMESDNEEETERRLRQYNQEVRSPPPVPLPARAAAAFVPVVRAKSAASVSLHVALPLQNSRTFTFDQKEEDKRIRLCRGLLTVLRRSVRTQCQRVCLETLRILSRDKRVLSPVATREGMLVLAGLAGLVVAEEMGDTPGEQQREDEDGKEEVSVEALKCLCNVVFNSTAAQQVAVDIQLAGGLCRRLQVTHTSCHEVGLFSLRLLFLLSALQPDLRVTLRQEQRAMSLLTSVLEKTLGVRWVGPYEVAAPEPSTPPVQAEANERLMEVMKTLFNLTLANSTEEDGDHHQLRLICAIMRHVLMLKTETEEKTEEAHSHAINLLSNMPVYCLDVLIDLPVRGGLEQHGGKNMEVVQALLDFMEKRIDRVVSLGVNYKEGLTPVLSLLTESSRHHREIRRFIKAQVGCCLISKTLRSCRSTHLPPDFPTEFLQVLPPLKDVKNRPEVGTTIRNKLVRLMTHVDMGVKQSAAEFLFVLCKESVDNLLKYTGYGNAAGLLAARGLLAGGRGEGQYSEDEDSDTEEYKSAKPFINPITGHVEEPMPNSIEEMTEEQKEYEAEKLANMFDQLSRQQVIRPMGVRPDGTLAPLEETISQCTVESEDSDPD
ncbi:synembryn-B-like [Scleropages formosus]|uniref:Synembryn n=1 Tax=Scleropages formosus TaxID=113540 RepID=A0A0P7UVR6_SCLFO|nr:synembryn-B-like [Scleropages formosus]